MEIRTYFHPYPAVLIRKTDWWCRVIKVWDPRKLNALSTKAPVAIETSKPPGSHVLRPYGITSITTQSNRIFALSKDSQYSYLSPQTNASLYSFDLGHLDHGPTNTFSHPRLRCDTFWIKIALQNDLIATGSSDAVVLLLSSNPAQWGRGAVVLRGGHAREVSDVSWSFDTGGGGEVVSISDDMVARVWRNGTGLVRDEGEMGCGYGWAEV